MIHFANPYFLLLILMVFPLYLKREKGNSKFKYSSIRKILTVSQSQKFHPRQILIFLRLLVFILMVIAFARPQKGRTFTKTNSKGIDIYLAVDTSGSMRALDFKIKGERVERLDMVKVVAKDFVTKRSGDRLGLVVFGTQAFTQCPLTLDHGIILDFLDRMEIGMAGESTAIGYAIATTVKRMKKLKSKSKVVILLTDGKSMENDISSKKAAELAKNFGIKIYTIGVGTNGKAPIIHNGLLGKQIAWIKVDIDEDSLKEIAKITGGKYFRANDTDQLKNIYKIIDKLEKTKIKVKQYTEYKEYFYLFLIAALLILLLEITLSFTFLKKVP